MSLTIMAGKTRRERDQLRERRQENQEEKESSTHRNEARDLCS